MAAPPLASGNTAGVSSLGVLISILVGGGLFGLMGMVLCVPTYAVIYTLIKRMAERRLRKRNLKNAFRLELPVQGRHMVIVDDVVTTGSTVAEIAQLLLRNGAATVQVWCLCRTL